MQSLYLIEFWISFKAPLPPSMVVKSRRLCCTCYGWLYISEEHVDWHHRRCPTAAPHFTLTATRVSRKKRFLYTPHVRTVWHRVNAAARRFQKRPANPYRRPRCAFSFYGHEEYCVLSTSSPGWPAFLRVNPCLSTFGCFYVFLNSRTALCMMQVTRPLVAEKEHAQTKRWRTKMGRINMHSC